MQPTQGQRPLRTIVDRYGWPKVLIVACIIGALGGWTSSELKGSDGPDSWSPAFKAGRKDAYDWSFINESPDTALHDCEAGVAHDNVLGQLDAKTVDFNDQQLVDWSRGCVNALRDFMSIPTQSWEK